MRNSWSFSTAGQLVFGSGSVDELGVLVRRRSIDRVLIVTDPPLVNAGIVDRVRRSLAEAQIAIEVFDGGRPEPAVEVAQQVIDAARGFRPGAILGLGGGSNMDLAKIAAAAYSHGGVPSDFFGFDNVPGPVVPLVCVPTTAGTGSEVSHAAVLTDTANQVKVSTLSNYLRPTLAVVDPLLTHSCPRQATADSGIDALTHAIEARTNIDYCDLAVPPTEAVAYTGRQPLGDCLAERAIELIGIHLVTAVREPQNIAAREGMALAATLAGMAFSNCGVAVVHALEYPLGGALHCTHGAGNGLLLPFVMRFNLPARRAELGRIAALLGADTRGMDADAAAEAAIAAVDALKRAIGIPERIRDIGGTRDQLPLFAQKSYAIKRLMLVNPRLPSEADLLGILEQAF